ncbi:MAG: hypothetical protein C4539_16045 [Ignavibacteriales bacterium]|nr:MAG: hypothetical protein C4539_16045 [Ignavibacteriales bacterium]
MNRNHLDIVSGFHLILFFTAIILCNGFALSQEKVEGYRVGRITFISSRLVYIQFEITDSLNTGDTLFQRSNGKLKPVMRIKYISSRSCAAEKDTLYTPTLNDEIIAIVRSTNNSIKVDSFTKTEVPRANIISSKKDLIEPVLRKKNYYGRFSMQSLTNLTNTDKRNNYQRWRYALSFRADTINGSTFSASSYLFFAYNTKDWREVKDNIGHALKVYDLSFSFKPYNRSRVWFGRHLNRNVSGIGSIDGITYQQTIENYNAGALIGSHPDFRDYGYNFKMFEYGIYFSRTDTFETSQMDNSIAFFQQTNNFKTDRRFLYFQHSDNLLPALNFFASSEIDLFKREKGISETTLTLTSLYFNLYYNPLRELSFSFSYDARRNVVYYETYKSFIDSLFENEIRQGYRLSVLVRPLNKLTISLNGGYRFRKNDPAPSKNFGANLYYSSIPFINISSNLSYTNLASGYTEGETIGLHFSKYFDLIDLSLSADYRMIKYKFRFSTEELRQNIISGDVSYKLPLNIYFGLNYEGTFEKSQSYGRFYIDITKRF